LEFKLGDMHSFLFATSVSDTQLANKHSLLIGSFMLKTWSKDTSNCVRTLALEKCFCD